jgi:hypothetical protein
MGGQQDEDATSNVEGRVMASAGGVKEASDGRSTCTHGDIDGLFERTVKFDGHAG